MAEIKKGWQVKGTYNESCAAEGHCPFYFGRPVQNGCRYYMVFRISEGKVNDVDLSGITIIYNGDIPHSTVEELMELGSEGGIYISDNATPEQREVLDAFAVQETGGHIMKKVFGVKYVKIDIDEDGKTFHIKMPFGEMKQTKTTGPSGEPMVIHNTLLPFLGPVTACHTDFWNHKDHNRNFEYKDRCGSWADFTFEG